MNHKRSSFSGKLGFVLSAAGASVGLGNIWRFPYLAAKYGGGIFLLVYIILALTFGYTMIVAETALGRMTKKSPVGAYESFGKSKWLSFGGWINAVIPILIVPYYSVIGGWSSNIWLNTFLDMDRPLPQTNISPRLFPTVVLRRSALFSSPCLQLLSFTQVYATGSSVYRSL